MSPARRPYTSSSGGESVPRQRRRTSAASAPAASSASSTRRWQAATWRRCSGLASVSSRLDRQTQRSMVSKCDDGGPIASVAARKYARSSSSSVEGRSMIKLWKRAEGTWYPRGGARQVREVERRQGVAVLVIEV